MRAVVTRVNSASVTIDGEVQARIGKGLLVLLGVHREDTEKEASKIADKICGLRIFEDENGKMNLSPDKVQAEMIIVSSSPCSPTAVPAGRAFPMRHGRKRPFPSMNRWCASAESAAFPFRPAFSLPK